MRDQLILTFDMGTQSARAMLVDAKGGIVAKQQKVYEKPYHSSSPGWAEQDAEFYWAAICETCLGLKEKAAEYWPDIIAVTCTTIRNTCLCLDAQNEPLREVILWLDGRETNELKELPPVTNLAFRLTQMKETIDLQRKVSACNWISAKQPEIWAKTAKFVFLSAWLTYRFCGRLVDSSASIIGHIPFDVRIRNWMKNSDLRRSMFDLPNDKLCELIEPGQQMGTITREAAAQSGLPEGIPLIATGSDKGCETLGLSCLSPDKAALSFGTTATVQVTTPNYVEPLPFIPPYPSVVSGLYNPEVEIFRGFWLLSWFKKEFGAKEVEEAKERKVSAEELLNVRLREIPPGCDGLIMQPYFTPGIMMPHAKGAIIGFSDVHTRIHIYRAIIEGIGFSLMEGLRNIEKRGHFKVKKLYVAGGGSQSDEICQIIANMFGLPLYRTQTYEVSGIGSSLTAFVALGTFPDYAAAVEAMVHIRDEFLPDPGEHKIYRELYEQIYCKIFDRLSPLYQRINEINSRAQAQRKEESYGTPV
jgi:sugar (pentulose or hexulose) kinase